VTDFIGRGAELATLKDLTRLDSASLVVIKGRRRVGKSRVARELAVRLPEYRSVLLEGMAPSDQIAAADEREDFAQQLSTKLSIPPPRSDDWNTLLWTLADRTREGKWIIILDEINWLGGKDPTFLPKLKSAWDQYFSANRSLIMILSGSLTGWIEKNILHSTAFVGRVHVNLTLDELPLRHCGPFFNRGHSYLSSYEKFRILSVTGGIPAYLERIDPRSTADANIERLCFKRDGYLFGEFETLFHDLFERKLFYRQLMEAVAEEPLDLESIYRKMGVQKSTYVSNCIEDLIQTGFLARHYTWNISSGTISKRSRIRVVDNYTRFYFLCIRPNKDAVERSAGRLPDGIDGMLGMQFENMILKNRPALWERLRIDARDIVFENPYWQKATIKKRGCQIDYMIQCRNNTLYACEIKFSKDPLPASLITEVTDRIDAISRPRHYSIRPALIHVNGVSNAIADARYFDELIDLSDLWS
jgi:uncharacterized protein